MNPTTSGSIPIDLRDQEPEELSEASELEERRRATAAAIHTMERQAGATRAGEPGAAPPVPIDDADTSAYPMELAAAEFPDGTGVSPKFSLLRALRGQDKAANPAPPPVEGMPLGEESPSEVGSARSQAPRTLMRALRLLTKPHAEVQQWMARVQQEIAQAREATDGLSSGKTMVIMTRALVGLRETAEGRTRSWRRRLVALALFSALAVAGLSGVIWFQQRRITALVTEKVALDAQIQNTLEAMTTETDEAKLAELEAKLQTLMGSASEKILEVSRANAKRGAELAQPADPLEEEIRKILRSFHADTYAIPPIFKAALQKQVNELGGSPVLRSAYARKQRYWPHIEQALRRKQLPEELGYIAFTESGFDPQARNPKSQASGMWQLMDEVARNCGITVSEKLDERFDASRSSDAAACYLSKLMVEFGEESFMLTLASYNRGENGVRRALHKVAMQPGGYRKRDFWHLYRLKLLPEETREYVPKVLAAAIVLGNPQKYGLARPN